MPLLECACCKQQRPEEDFRKAWRLNKKSGEREFRKDNKRNGRFSYCRPCTVELQQEYKERKDPEDFKEGRRASHYRTTYGLTLSEYERLNTLRDKGCWICGRPGVKKGLNVDHNHKTGQIRGLLCSQCNRGLRWFRDCPADLRKAAEYLEKYDQWMVEALMSKSDSSPA